VSEQLLIEFNRLVASWLWVVLVAILIAVFYEPIREEVLPRMSGFRALGSRVPQLEASLEAERV